ncbi:MAG TPA: LPS assembly protein LptD [Vicinamibacteria bacterium]|nr:LPS assembly protein LptD [Vicinamibacteria bacterium]
MPPAAVPPAAVPPAAAPARPAEPLCDPGAGDVCLSAETQERLEKGHVRARGFVDLRFGDSRIQAEQLDIFDTDKPDGTVGRRIEATGNVVFLRGDERLAGQKLTMDLDSGHGVFTDVVGFVQPGVFIEAREIERVDDDTFRIKGGKFTSCAQPTPRWSFSATSATMDVDDKIVARNVLFKVKQVPAMYIPIFAYPIQEDQRSTGLLFPHFGDASVRGFNIGGGFFWAMGRSYDQTFYVDHYTQAGLALAHEFRYALKTPSRGTFNSRFFRDTTSEVPTWDFDLHWNALQMLPGNVRASVQADFTSDQSYKARFNDRIDIATSRQRVGVLNLQRQVWVANVQLQGETRDYFGDEDTFSRRRRLPALLLNQAPRKFRRTGLVLSWAARAENLEFGNQDLVNRYSRYDLFPRLQRPLSVSFLQFTPEVGVRYTAYSTRDLDDEGPALDLTGPGLQRRYLESSVDMRGPTFSRVFDTPGNFYSERFKHVIGPEVTWTYRTRVDDFNAIPRFDQHDAITGTNQVRYGLVQRFYAKRAGPSGKLEPYEFLSWRVGQTYYVQIGASEFDPNYSSAFFSASGEPSHWSPVQSQVVLRPTPQVSNHFDFEYDTNFRLFRRVGLTTSVTYPRFLLQGTYSRSRRAQPENQELFAHTVRGGSRVVLWPNKLALDGSADYDLLQKRMIQTTGRLRYDVQCCGFMLEMVNSNYRDPPERQFRFSVELANIGSMGNFMGGPEERR